MTEEAIIAEIWFIITGRIFPDLCCRIPPPEFQVFKKALQEAFKKDGDLDLAVNLLNEIISNVPVEWTIFEQAGELLNVIGWRTRYHPEWFGSKIKRRPLHPGRCGPHVAHAYALMQAGGDEDALILTSRIIEEGDEKTDDIRVARLIRASIFICQGEHEKGEEEINRISG
jgi:hypothetical protein